MMDNIYNTETFNIIKRTAIERSVAIKTTFSIQNSELEKIFLLAKLDHLYAEISVLPLKHPVFFVLVTMIIAQNSRLNTSQLTPMAFKELFQWICLSVFNQEKQLGLVLPNLGLKSTELFDELDRIFSVLEQPTFDLLEEK